jgi:ABC-type transport system involved in cytochrome c biogenesis ATPase subunit
MDKLEKLMLQHLAAGGIILAATHVSLPIISAELPIRGPN